MRTLTLIGVAALAALCVAPAGQASENTVLGTGLGAAIGGLFGSQIGHGGGQLAATGLGVAVGGLIGNGIGHQMDAEPYYPQTRYVAAERAPVFVYTPYAPTYVAPPSPPPIYIDEDNGTYCREYSQTVRIGGRARESYGTACLQPDGSWRIVE
ncbi:MAG: glycine zipper 2TM domain-containing protein [Alphaproteobacteria bacterium]|nr:glycine zipper 2TM domain-containing protein [Alphaproteobacteria bacterium]